MSKMSINGVIPPMLTPFKENGDVDYECHVRNLERWNQNRLCGYLVLGSNSEAAFLNEKEKLELIELTARHAKKERLVLAGTGMESVRETIRLTNRAADLGAHAALILTPSYYHEQMVDEALIGFFSEVADNVKIPVMIYNVTKFTHINISPKAVGVLSRHENIIGMKDSNGNVPQLVNFQSVIAEDFNLMVGTAAAWYPALALGIKAGIFAVANCIPDECARVQEFFEDHQHAKAREIYRRIFPVNTALTATFGVGGLKYASQLLGYEGGTVRRPLMPLKEGEKEKLREILKAADLL
jgi:4-hydroxy-tetrahydrodipicolinate synthase